MRLDVAVAHGLLASAQARLARKAHEEIQVALRQVAAPLERGEDARPLAAEMIRTMIEGGGIGLAAPQLGVSKRLIVGLHQSEGWSFVLINPVITKRDKHRVWGREGCLSLPGKLVGVRRHKTVTVEGHDVEWKPVRIKARGLLARVLQHEIDHLDGRLMTDGEEPDPSRGTRERKLEHVVYET
jgi:peptide deformylase